MGSLTRGVQQVLGTRVRATATLLAGVSIMAAGLFPGVLTGAAAGAPDVGNAGVFELDGTIGPDATTNVNPPYDWSCVFNNPTGQTGCPPSATPANPATTPTLLGTVFEQDFVTPDPTYFTSNKDIQDISQWGCTTLNNPLAKDDLLNAYGAVFIAPASSTKANHVLLYLAQERASSNGDSFAGFWLMHHQHSCSGSGSFSNPAHDTGDLLVVSNYTNGGGTSTIQVFAWDTTAPNNLRLLADGFTCGAASPPPGLVHPDDICGIANASGVTEPWAPQLALKSNQFVEAGLDLTDLISQNIFPVSTQTNAACFNDFLAETRSSQELTATLKDYASGRFTFCVAPHVTTQQTAGTTTSASMVVEKGTQVTDQATLGAPLSGTPAGTMTYNLYPASANCTGTPTFTSGPKTLSGGVAPPSDPTPTSLAVGAYEWQAVYSGDTTLTPPGHNFPSMSTCGDEPLTVVDASIGISPSAINQVGTPHTFTVTVNANVPTGTSVAFNSIATSITNLANATVTPTATTCAAPTVLGNQATCTVTVNSTTVDKFTANASATLTLGGLTVHRSTDGHAPNSGPAIKQYVDAFITITPHLKVNVVGAPHEFDVTVTAVPGTTGTPSFSAITTSVVDNLNNPPAQLTTTCGSPTVVGNVASCKIDINNFTADTFTATATDTVTFGGVGGLPVTVTTNGVGLNSPPATKVYGNGIISITPTAVNEVGTPHTFNVVVVGVAGATTTFGPVSYSVQDASHNAPGSVTSNCATPTPAHDSITNTDSVSCTITINNSTADVFTATASDAVTVNGFTTTLTTNNTNGSSGPATKTYVDASIGIASSAVNVVGNQHIFTVTVTGSQALTPSPTTPLTITTSVLDSHGNAPSTMSTTCGSPTVNGATATCTITINNSSADVFTANATATIPVDGLELHRSTDSTVATHGPVGTGPATKTYVDANITIAQSAVNEVGQQHVFTVTVTGLQANQPFSVQSITTSVIDGLGNPPGTMSTTCGNPTVNGNVATCTITIDDSTADVFTATATAHVTVDGLQLTRSTDGTGANSGPATKTYVDGSIAISPLTKDNEVGNLHVFTITATALPAGQTIAFNSITPTLSVNPSSVIPTQDTSTCGSPTINGNVATCTVTINSASAATYTLDATAVMTIDGLEIARSTTGNSGPGGTGSATKNYVDAAVGIGLTAVNPIGQQHVFTIVVNAYPAGATPVVFNSITPSVSPQPLTSSNTCANPTVSTTPTGEQATCTLTINNDLPATFTANVTTSVSMGTVTVTRSTASNPGPGGTGPATKTYVTANIGLSPLTASDPVGDLHTLTATVTTNNGSGEGQPVPAPNGTVVSFSIVSGPGSLASPSCTITNGLGTCTDVLTSAVAGTTVVNASTTVTVLGVDLHRSTNDSVPGDSVNAVKNWFKVQPTITTVQSASGTVGTVVSDTATVAGGNLPTGTVTFQLFGPTDTTCSGTPVFTSSNDPLTGGKAASGSFTPTTTGTYEWVATYNGDAGNLTAVSKCGDEPVTIAASGVLGIVAIPNTGAGLMQALAEGLGLILAGTGIALLARRRRRAVN